MSGTKVLEVLESRWQPLVDGPVVVGIGGGSGAGKSSLAGQLVEGLRPLVTETVNLDQFFKSPSEMPSYHSTLHDEDRPNFNRPDSFHREEMISSCRSAASLQNPEPDVLLIEGILALYFIELRSLMHLRCYVQVSLEQMLARRKERNLAAGYGGTETEIDWYNRECVSPEHKRFNAPTSKHADVLISNGDGDGVTRDRTLAEVCSSIQAVRAR